MRNRKHNKGFLDKVKGYFFIEDEKYTVDREDLLRILMFGHWSKQGNSVRCVVNRKKFSLGKFILKDFRPNVRILKSNGRTEDFRKRNLYAEEMDGDHGRHKQNFPGYGRSR